MKLVYIDESGNTGLNFKDKQQPIFLLSALVIDEAVWFQIENNYHELLKKCIGNDLPIEYEVHAIDLKSGKGLFKNISDEKRKILRKDLFDLIRDSNIPIFYRRIIKSNFEKFCHKIYGTGIQIHPYIMAIAFLCLDIDNYLRKINSLGMLIFDEQKEYYQDVERSIKTLRLDNMSSLKTTSIIEKGFFVDSKLSFGIQLTDFIAYYLKKSEEQEIGCFIPEIFKPEIERLKELNIIRGSDKIIEVTEWVKQNFIK